MGLEAVVATITLLFHGNAFGCITVQSEGTTPHREAEARQGVDCPCAMSNRSRLEWVRRAACKSRLAAGSAWLTGARDLSVYEERLGREDRGAVGVMDAKSSGSKGGQMSFDDGPTWINRLCQQRPRGLQKLNYGKRHRWPLG